MKKFKYKFRSYSIVLTALAAVIFFCRLAYTEKITELNSGGSNEVIGYNSFGDSIKQSHIEIMALNRKNADCCVANLSKSIYSRPNLFKPLITDMHNYIFVEQKGKLKIGEIFDLTPYLDKGINGGQIYQQLIEAGFRYTGAYPDASCITTFSTHKRTSLCGNLKKCDDCIVKLIFSYDDTANQALFSIGQPSYRIRILLQGDIVLSAVASIHVRK